MAEKFANRVLILGTGSVSQSVLPLLIEHLVDAKQITIMDQRDNRARVQDALNKGATYVQDVITRENLDAQLSKYLKAEISYLIWLGTSMPTQSLPGAMTMVSCT